MIDSHAVLGKGVRIYEPSLSNIGRCTIGDDCVVHTHVWIGDGVVVGAHSKIQAFAFLPPGVRIGKRVFIGPHVCFTNDKHPTAKRGPWDMLETVVGNGASIGARAVILPGVVIGENSVVGAGSVVVRDVEPHSVVYGAPAVARTEEVSRPYDDPFKDPKHSWRIAL